MRRSDREVTDAVKICDIIDRCHCCRIGFCDDGEVYIVPMSFGYVYSGGEYTFYFHSAKQGRKIDLIEKCPNVGIELDTGYELERAELACGYTARYKSVIGNGEISLVTDIHEKITGLCELMKHTAGEGEWQFDEHMLESVAVFKVTVTKLTCKEHL